MDQIVTSERRLPFLPDNSISLCWSQLTEWCLLCTLLSL